MHCVNALLLKIEGYIVQAGNKYGSAALICSGTIKLINIDNSKICPVCGSPNLIEGSFDDFGCSTYEICPCCGFEFGFDDITKHLSL